MKIFKADSKIKIMLTGGDSGGHVFPLVSVLKEMQKFLKEFDSKGIDLEFYYIGSNDFTLDYIKDEKINLYPLNMNRWKKSKGFFKNVVGIFVNFVSFVKAYIKMIAIMPDAIFAKGSFASVMVLMIGIVFRIPIFVHESDAVPGFVNQIFGKFAKIVFISFENSAKYFNNKNIQLVGNPMDESLKQVLASNYNTEELKEQMGLDMERKVILVLGGSQGAKTINNLVLDVLPEALQKYQIIHQAGAGNFEDVRRQADVTVKEFLENKSDGKHYHLLPFLNHSITPAINSLAFAMMVSDIVVSRAGSGGIFEIAAFKKPSVLIPLPWASRHHQEINAFEFSKDGTAVSLEQANLKPNILMDTIDSILESKEKMTKMQIGCEKFAKVDAGEKIAKGILKEMIKQYSNNPIT